MNETISISECCKSPLQNVFLRPPSASKQTSKRAVQSRSCCVGLLGPPTQLKWKYNQNKKTLVQLCTFNDNAIKIKTDFFPKKIRDEMKIDFNDASYPSNILANILTTFASQIDSNRHKNARASSQDSHRHQATIRKIISVPSCSTFCCWTLSQHIRQQTTRKD